MSLCLQGSLKNFGASLIFIHSCIHSENVSGAPTWCSFMFCYRSALVTGKGGAEPQASTLQQLASGPLFLGAPCPQCGNYLLLSRKKKLPLGVKY